MNTSESFCEYAFDHEPNEICLHCKLEVDKSGNTEEDFLNCSYPRCGCDGVRLCVAKNGANANSKKYNVEGVYQRTDKTAIKAKLGLLRIVSKDG